MICFYHNLKKKCIFIQSYFLPGKLPLELIKTKQAAYFCFGNILL